MGALAFGIAMIALIQAICYLIRTGTGSPTERIRVHLDLAKLAALVSLIAGIVWLFQRVS